MNSFRKFIAFILMLLFVATQVANFISSYAVSFHKKEIRNNRANLNKNISIQYDYHDWQQVKKINQDEIEIQGKMFDISSIYYHEHSVEVIGHFDSKEDILIAQSNQSDKPVKKASFFSFYFFCNIENVSAVIINEEYHESYFIYDSIFLSDFINHIDQPPKFV